MYIDKKNGKKKKEHCRRLPVDLTSSDRAKQCAHLFNKRKY